MGDGLPRWLGKQQESLLTTPAHSSASGEGPASQAPFPLQTFPLPSGLSSVPGLCLHSSHPSQTQSKRPFCPVILAHKKPSGGKNSPLCRPAPFLLYKDFQCHLRGSLPQAGEAISLLFQ